MYDEWPVRLCHFKSAEFGALRSDFSLSIYNLKQNGNERFLVFRLNEESIVNHLAKYSKDLFKLTYISKGCLLKEGVVCFLYLLLVSLGSSVRTGIRNVVIQLSSWRSIEMRRKNIRMNTQVFLSFFPSSITLCTL